MDRTLERSRVDRPADHQLAGSDVVADGVPLAFYVDGAEHLLRIALPPAAITQSHVVTAYLNLTSPPPYEARINCGGRPYLDRAGEMWAEDRLYAVGSFGIAG